MAHVPPSEDVRPRRQTRQPRWMDDYEGYTIPQAVTYPVGAYAAEEQTDWNSTEGFAEMTPLTPHRLHHTQYSAESIEASPSHVRAAAPVRNQLGSLPACLCSLPLSPQRQQQQDGQPARDHRTSAQPHGADLIPALESP
ncbi:hypothetical protein PAMA_002803 [Pampus argenteus]